ncbi:hypothetical protein Q9L58_002060 [Maublancomyces gigas]|uniref:Uncharacterized protein n=1 Tax=Discina gigas TaxID=1032678 RepID=A0ABR3GTB7_9PEZI
MLAIHLPTSPISESPRGFSFPSAPSVHQQHFSLVPLPIQKKPAARPKLSLKITADDKRTFGSKSSGSSSFLKAPLTAGPLSPTTLTTMRNTQFNARRPTSDVPQLSIPEPSYSSSSSCDDSTVVIMEDINMHSEMKDKKRKRRFQRDSHPSRDLLIRTSHPVAPSCIPITISLPAPQPSKRAMNPSARRVSFADAPIIIPGPSVYVAESYASSDESSTDESSDSESEETPVRTVMEQMEEINKLRHKVQAMDVQMAEANSGHEQKAEKSGGECSSWMFRLGKMEYDEISKQEAAEASSSTTEGGVGFGFGSGIKF